ncbi:hypothetical protein NMY22_g17614 [Coprinellus aureogranulatus]|nr:hypothetical protein NMY22_g17614 [Coprinellus aureogranulatus]
MHAEYHFQPNVSVHLPEPARQYRSSRVLGVVTRVDCTSCSGTGPWPLSSRKKGVPRLVHEQKKIAKESQSYHLPVNGQGPGACIYAPFTLPTLYTILGPAGLCCSLQPATDYHMVSEHVNLTGNEPADHLRAGTWRKQSLLCRIAVRDSSLSPCPSSVDLCRDFN